MQGVPAWKPLQKSHMAQGKAAQAWLSHVHLTLSVPAEQVLDSILPQYPQGLGLEAPTDITGYWMCSGFICKWGGVYTAPRV